MGRDGENPQKFKGVDQRFAVATHAMCVLATRGQAISSAQFISENISVSAIIIKRVMRPIVVGGYVEAVVGAVGGYRLIRDPNEINLWLILEAIQGSGPFSKRFGMPESNCDEGRAIDQVVYDLYSSLDVMIEERLRAVSLASILQSAMSQQPPK
ncbi:Rrf2 family transcriptional regulator [uncultured Celeribacter sp.]|uniref:Rrf2 family transcriptional regulator n=1 Tax=uncultured Celeribacter sp. TaxID=1303376 RepID=UPI002AA74D1A|nr:Rrf2 family transcriptional regulator [uncultured Celeribacter sp.]